MKLHIFMAVPSLRNKPLNFREIGSSTTRLSAIRTTRGQLMRQFQQGRIFCKRFPLLLCFNERVPESGLARSQQESSKSQVELPGLLNLQQSTQVEGKSTIPFLKTQTESLLAHYVPVFVMLPLDVISNENVLQQRDLLTENLKALKAAHVDGLMVDVWWGIVEAGPKKYDWPAYRELFKLTQMQGFKLQAIMSFHQYGGNIGDNITIPLPKWVLKIGESNPNIFFTNKDGQRNKECLTFGIDDQPVLQGRIAIEVYSDFMKSFRENMSDFLDSGAISEIEVGLGPAGELRYPSFTESQGWEFPGIGELQCYDKYLLSDLKAAAESIRQPDLAFSTPNNAGTYNDQPNSTDFFKNNGAYMTDHGKFFLTWYSTVLLRHGDKILEAASQIFEGLPVKLAAKISGIHWWYKFGNHAAELTVGYYNLSERDGYRPIARMLARHRAVLNFTCIEMQDEEQPSEAGCGPEALVKQVLNAGWNEGIEVSCENALPRYDREGYDQIIRQARPDGINRENPPQRRISTFTYLRLSEKLMQADHLKEFKRFVKRMHVGLDYQADPEKHFNPRRALQRSKPKQDIKEFVAAAVPLDAPAINYDSVRKAEDSCEDDERPVMYTILKSLLSPFSWFKRIK